MSKKVLEVKNLTKYYGKVKGIENISFTLEKGEIFGFIGPNGSGKSTTIRSIMNLLNKNSGYYKPLFTFYLISKVLKKFLCFSFRFLLILLE